MSDYRVTRNRDIEPMSPRRAPKKKPQPDPKVEVVCVDAPDAKERVAEALAILLRRAARKKKEVKDDREED